MRKERLVLEKVPILSVAAEGKCIARVDNRVIFVRNTAPGDVIDVKITKKKKNYYEGLATQFHEYSDQRIEPVCSHFGTCGGCKWQHLSYSSQLQFKQQQVVDALERIGKIDASNTADILPADQTEFYRNKLEYAFSNKRWLSHEEIASGKNIDRNGVGFHVPGRFDRVVNLDKCYLQAEPSNKLRDVVKAFAKDKNLSYYNHAEFEGFLRNLIVRTSTLGEVMVIVQFGHADEENTTGLLDHLLEKVSEITSLHYIINTKKNETFYDQEVVTHHGPGYILEQIGNLKFKIGPKSFFQTNTKQAEKLYQITKEFADLSGKETVYDLYCGTGTITNYLAKNAKFVLGIESVPESIEDAQWNADYNKITNTDFVVGDMKDVLDERVVEKYGRPDVMITDPPRAGMHPKVVEKLNELKAPRVVYVSCNPATQARDLEMMSSHYKVEKIQPVDMFPHTHHVECVVSLKLIQA